MFGFGDDPVRRELAAAFERAWAEIAGPGTWWTGGQCVAIAGAARRGFLGDSARDPGLPPATNVAAQRIAVEPATTTESWVNHVTAALGEPPYVELVGIVARVVAIDTFCRLTGRPLVALPEPQPGEPSCAPPPPNGAPSPHVGINGDAGTPVCARRGAVRRGGDERPHQSAVHDRSANWGPGLPARRPAPHADGAGGCDRVTRQRVLLLNLAHTRLLRWRTQETGRTINLAGIVDDDVEPGRAPPRWPRRCCRRAPPPGTW